MKSNALPGDGIVAAVVSDRFRSGCASISIESSAAQGQSCLESYGVIVSRVRCLEVDVRRCAFSLLVDAGLACGNGET